MSPISFHTFRTIPTTIDLNGPYLSFTEQPVTTATTSGSSIELIGIATMTFVDNSGPGNTGIITYKWYESGIGPLVEGTNVTGTATTTLTLSNLQSPEDNNRKFFLRADYAATTETGNATNEPLDSNETTITIYPNIEIIGQPTDASTIANSNVSFTVNASLTDAAFTEGLTYQWSLNGNDLTDGTLTIEVPATRVEQVFSNNATHTIPASGQNVVIAIAGGSGGSGGTDAGGSGGSGGKGRSGTFTYANGPRTLDIYIGRNGGSGGSGNASAGGSGGSSGVANGGSGGGAGPGGWSGGGGGGGALSAILDREIQTNQGGGTTGYTIVAGGGGGGGGASLGRSGSGAGSAGPFIGMTQPIPVRDGAQGNTKSGGDGGGGGAGGAGVSGGGPGSPGNDNSSGGSGGGGGTSGYDVAVASLVSETTNDSSGFATIEYDVPDGSGTETITTNITISDSQTDTLTLSSDAIGVSQVACKISHVTASNSPITSDTARFIVLDNATQFIVNIEGIDNTDEANLSTTDLFNGELTLETSTPDDGTSVAANYWVLYSPDKDIEVEMDLYGGKGGLILDRPFVGGEGGFSRIRFTMEKNVEYVLTGLNSLVNAPFLYRKSTLIASVGAGGGAGSDFNGGFGGGIGVDGQDGFGGYGGNGGQSVDDGNLSLDGIFGSVYTGSTVVDNDTIATGVSGGRALSCTKGQFYRGLGIAPCADFASNSKFVQADGTIVTNTASISRGFKAGYSIIETNGMSTTGGGIGGAGATGGDGGEQGSGGGGGSGYTNGFVSVISSILGGSNGSAKAVLRAVYMTK